MPDGEFDWGGRLRKGIGGAQRFPQNGHQWDNRRLYHYYRCPQCRQKLRVPRGRGRIQISCPRCGTQFIKTMPVQTPKSL